jgi:diguanylate cyclase (GGDEF)-like protein
MAPSFGLLSVAANGLTVSGLCASGLCALASLWHARRESRRVESIAGEFAQREREMRFAAHALMTASRTSPQAVIDTVTHAAQLLAPEIDSMLFALVQGEVLRIEHAQGMHAAHVLGTRTSLEGDSSLALAFRHRHRILSTEGPTTSIPMGGLAAIAIPFVELGRVIGVISFTSRRGAIIGNADALVALIDLAVPAYLIALDRKAHIQSATVDELTGLLTPRAFRERLYNDLADVRLQSLQATLFFIDTDHFKACNDTYGHAAGDVVLSVIASLLKQEAGSEAIVGRNGGDEFCVLLRTGKSTAVRRAEAMRHEVARYRFEHHLGVVPAKPITLSIGLASFPDDTNDAAQLLERADAAMYHSKRSGRNAVSFFTDAQTPVTVQQASC